MFLDLSKISNINHRGYDTETLISQILFEEDSSRGNENIDEEINLDLLIRRAIGDKKENNNFSQIETTKDFLKQFSMINMENNNLINNQEEENKKDHENQKEKESDSQLIEYPTTRDEKRKEEENFQMSDFVEFDPMDELNEINLYNEQNKKHQKRKKKEEKDFWNENKNENVNENIFHEAKQDQEKKRKEMGKESAGKETGRGEEDVLGNEKEKEKEKEKQKQKQKQNENEKEKEKQKEKEEEEEKQKQKQKGEEKGIKKNPKQLKKQEFINEDEFEDDIIEKVSSQSEEDEFRAKNISDNLQIKSEVEKKETKKEMETVPDQFQKTTHQNDNFVTVLKKEKQMKKDENKIKYEFININSVDKLKIPIFDYQNIEIPPQNSKIKNNQFNLDTGISNIGSDHSGENLSLLGNLTNFVVFTNLIEPLNQNKCNHINKEKRIKLIKKRKTLNGIIIDCGSQRLRACKLSNPRSKIEIATSDSLVLDQNGKPPVLKGKVLSMDLFFTLSHKLRKTYPRQSIKNKHQMKKGKQANTVNKIGNQNMDNSKTNNRNSNNSFNSGKVIKTNNTNEHRNENQIKTINNSNDENCNIGKGAQIQKQNTNLNQDNHENLDNNQNIHKGKINDSWPIGNKQNNHKIKNDKINLEAEGEGEGENMRDGKGEREREEIQQKEDKEGKEEIHSWLIIDSIGNSANNRNKIAKNIFNTLNGKQIYFIYQEVLSMYQFNAKTGLILNISTTVSVVPIIDEIVFIPGITRANEKLGVGILIEYLQKLFKKNGDELKKVFGKKYYSHMHGLFTSQSWVSLNPKNEKVKHKKVSKKILRKTIDGKKKRYNVDVIISNQLFQCMEPLFNPKMVHVNGPGIVDLIASSISNCPIKIKQMLLKNIILTGGVSKAKGLSERLKIELERKFQNTNFKINILQRPQNIDLLETAYFVSKFKLEKNNWLDKDDWLNNNIQSIKNKFFCYK
ncbi:actin cytoskeletal 2a [Anaeramoeba flamelloides]|uniref:Actin cytoskeletal 2a n=1 Tax=Anaeramoeba flamelloides TaxID=1746091 RepID=A0AAV7YU50_9EUKA|nr:actin cytoskeletal 2a [Anaeramoeba flamelloides]